MLEKVSNRSINIELTEKAKDRRGVWRDFGELRKKPNNLIDLAPKSEKKRTLCVNLTDAGKVVQRSYH